MKNLFEMLLQEWQTSTMSEDWTPPAATSRALQAGKMEIIGEYAWFALRNHQHTVKVANDFFAYALICSKIVTTFSTLKLTLQVWPKLEG